MNEIKCPKCGTVIKIDETDYESIVKQVRDKVFNEELKKYEKRFNDEKNQDIKMILKEQENERLELLNKKDLEINTLQNKLQTMELNTQVKLEKKYQDTINEKILMINELQKEIEITKTKKDNEILLLESEIDKKKNEYALKEKMVKEGFEEKMKSKDELIAYYKDFKAKQSTKMIGESLEVHCSTEFNRLRPLFKNAYFEKDNDVKTGSKGDFIFRDYDDDGMEIVSIMFEMKNEADKTATKHKNEDFLKELDKDRQEKKCEYAVLVSLLEIDNDYYNDGIVDVSHLYDKMYVIRPQFFIPIITLIRNLSLKALDYRKQLILKENENIDIKHFEDNINAFKNGFTRNWRLASERFSKAIDEIDKSIDHLQKIKENLLKTNDNLRLANNKLDDLTIKKLTHNNPTIQKMFEEIKK